MALPRSSRADGEQLAYRRLETVRLWNAHCSIEQIARALDVHISTIRDDLDAMEVPRTGRRFTGTPEDPPPVDWQHPPVAALEPEQVDQVALLIRHFLSGMKAARWQSSNASLVLAAVTGRDTGWLAKRRRLLGELQQVTGDLAAMLDGDDATPGLLAKVTGWAEETAEAPIPSRRPVGRPRAVVPPALREEIARRLEAGMAVSREGLAEQYGVGAHVVRNEHRRAVVVLELLAEGWQPPPGAR